ncbi:bifunctional adenosylcobinamide kinase/adenosylcobinamide-phosphate guanylyltransferase [Xylophilus sp. GOD-11R]|uniref:bifunctional adenosylcobinamide kinase/adenosylcobinamide-phosphate guanylyltransferase n=1 Tax=Xylophilus sp. GOD-11R TaxID=3089814 RepID=UPI00298D520D|nr:bifunctional adenosylcobinamide kinase/adenosylcobinamide-phosphate guanylyltransferase [Xylophilus sp. GOD-11R]WPB58556.1 bifunctional adenosylcobinamide kinase/adenosylcobinamide-phosphate guanylyltransferase [Xylophilus sp. GOD-11R]
MTPTVVASELVLGGQRSGKSRRAEMLAVAWLSRAPSHRAIFVVTAEPGDEEMRTRIERHRADRAERLPGAATVEAPRALAQAVALHSDAATLLVVDCLTLWLANLHGLDDAALAGEADALGEAVALAPGPVVLVSNEIGLGVVPMGREVRAYVDALGRLNQRLAAVCERVTLVAAGLPLALKGSL